MIKTDDPEMEERATEPADRPYWQTEPCPPWCWHAQDGGKPHQDHDRPDDRMHYSRWQGEVTLTLMPPNVTWDHDKLEVHWVEPVEAQVALGQRHREIEPRVILVVEGLPEDRRASCVDLDLTHAEARQLAAKLNDALQLAETPRQSIRKLRSA